jgi:ribosome-interacting GTPase 1
VILILTLLRDLTHNNSAKHQPQRVGITHRLEDEDVVQLMTK